MTFTTEERRLLVLYYTGSAEDTVIIMRDALADITEPDERAAAEVVIMKLECGNTRLDSLVPESVEGI